MHVTNQSVVSINIFPLVNWFRKYLWKARSRFNDNVTQVPLIDWLYIHYLSQLKNISTVGERLQSFGCCSGLTASEQGGVFYHATSAVTWALLLTVSFERPLAHLISLNNLQGVLGTYSNLDPHQNKNLRHQKA